MKLTRIINPVWILIHSRVVSLIKDEPFAPLIRIKYVMAVIATPPQMAPKYLRGFSYSNEKISRAMY